MKRLKGPELKMPDVKVPPFLADVYYDMRDRRLLPLVALVVVAIAAVPFLLGGSEQPLPADSATEEAAELEIADASNLTVVEAKPGLRDYRKRLRGRTPSDPFKQRYTSLPQSTQLESTQTSSGSGGGGADSGTTDVSVTEVDVTESGTSGGGASPAPTGAPGSAGAGSGSGDGLRYFGYRPDIRFGLAGSQDLTLHEDLSLGSLLPERKPLLFFIGVSQNGERAAFDVSPEVTMVRGGGACNGGRQSCHILFMHEGDAVDLLTASPERAFRLKLLSINFVEVDFPAHPKASGSMQPRSLGLAQNFSK
jgi:hypothetical protein